MARRAEDFAATRDKIVRVAMALHAEKGIQATNWEDIAARAEVAPTTVYRHFRSLKELVPECARVLIETIDPVTPEEAARFYRDLPTPAARLARLIQENCACYERGAGWINAVLRERELMPTLDELARAQEKSLEVMIRGAFDHRPVDRHLLAVLRALIDFPFWKALVAAGIPRRAAPAVITRIVENLVLESRRRP
jgi:AcrR family transcriptional regulator